MLLRILLIAFSILPVVAQGAPRLNAFAFPGRSFALLLVAALFYFGFKWRTR